MHDTRERLTGADVDEILRTEITDRLLAADNYDRGGRTDLASRLWREAKVLTAQLPG